MVDTTGCLGSESLLEWCEARRWRLARIAKVVVRAPDTPARDELFNVILSELEYCVEMMVSVTQSALEHRDAACIPFNLTVPIDIEVADTAIHFQALLLVPVAGAA
jgi:hypothetical protein